MFRVFSRERLRILYHPPPPYSYSGDMVGDAKSKTDLLKRTVGLALLIMILISPLAIARQLYAQTTTTPVSAGEGKCPGGYVNAILLANISIDRLLNIAYQNNIKLDQELIARAKAIYNLSINAVASMDSSGCKKLYSDLVAVIKNLLASVGLELEPEARGAYERATLRAAQRALNISTALNLSDIKAEIEAKIGSGNVSVKDLEKWEIKIRGEEISLKVQIVVSIVKGSIEEKILTPGDGTKALKDISIAEEILNRVIELLLRINASPNAIQAIERALLNIKEARSILESEKNLPEVNRLRAIADRLEARIKALNTTIGSVNLPSDVLTRIKSLLNESLKEITEARAEISKGNLSYAEKLLREAYDKLREAEDLFREAAKAVSKKAEDLLELREELEELIRDLAKLEREFNHMLAQIKIQDQGVEELVSRIHADIEQANKLIANITDLIKQGKIDEAKELMNRLENIVRIIERNIEMLKKLIERLTEELEELTEELDDISKEIADLRRMFEDLVKKASNTTDQRVKTLIDNIQKMFNDLNSAIDNIKKLIDAGKFSEARAIIEEAVKPLIESIEEAIESLSEILEEIGRGRK